MIGLKYPLKAALTLISVFSPSFSKEVGIVIYTTGGLGTGVYSLVQLKPIKLQKNESVSIAQCTLVVRLLMVYWDFTLDRVMEIRVYPNA